MYVFMYVCMYVCNVCTYVYLYLCMYAFMYVCMYVNTYVHTYVCMYAFVCISNHVLETGCSGASADQIEARCFPKRLLVPFRGPDPSKVWSGTHCLVSLVWTAQRVCYLGRKSTWTYRLPPLKINPVSRSMCETFVFRRGVREVSPLRKCRQIHFADLLYRFHNQGSLPIFYKHVRSSSKAPKDK